MDEHDTFNTDMFDELIHDTNQVPEIESPYICAYCNTGFVSRNKLFYHLGFMGIDIRDPKKAMTEEDEEEIRLRRKKRKSIVRKREYFARKARERNYFKAKRQRVEDLICDVEKLKLRG